MSLDELELEAILFYDDGNGGEENDTITVKAFLWSLLSGMTYDIFSYIITWVIDCISFVTCS